MSGVVAHRLDLVGLFSLYWYPSTYYSACQLPQAFNPSNVPNGQLLSCFDEISGRHPKHGKAASWLAKGLQVT